MITSNPKRVNKMYSKAEEGIMHAVNFHKKYHEPIYYAAFKACTAYPCRLVRDEREFYTMIPTENND